MPHAFVVQVQIDTGQSISDRQIVQYLSELAHRKNTALTSYTPVLYIVHDFNSPGVLCPNLKRIKAEKYPINLTWLVPAEGV